MTRTSCLPLVALLALALAFSGCVIDRGDGRSNLTGDPPSLGDDDDDDATGADDDDTGSDDDDTGDDDDDDTGDGDDDDDTGPIIDGPLGFIGSPCESSNDCDYDGGVCLFEDEGFPRGHCSQSCELYCPDDDGHPFTFCAESLEFPTDVAADLGDGGCVSRCDMGLFPDGGCRTGYGCVVSARANEPDTEVYVCLPNRASELSQCHNDLAARGVAFEPTVRADTSPSSHPNLTCHIEDPVTILSPVLGVDLLYYDGAPTNRVLASCEMAHALADTVEDVVPWDAVELLHIGTYVCRVIANTDTLSRHSFGDAIDIYGFGFGDGDTYTLVDDWEHDTGNPQGEGAAWLYDAAYRWFDDDIWNIILTPNYNAAHDNHFHVDLTPNSDYIGYWGGRYIGPAPYYD